MLYGFISNYLIVSSVFFIFSISVRTLLGSWLSDEYLLLILQGVVFLGKTLILNFVVKLTYYCENPRISVSFSWSECIPFYLAGLKISQVLFNFAVRNLKFFKVLVFIKRIELYKDGNLL